MKFKHSFGVALLCMPLLLAGNAQAQVAGSTSLGVSDLTLVANGWSVKKKVLGKTVYNEENKRVGKIEDIIVAPDGTASFIILGAGGFLGVARHDVAIPVGQILVKDEKLLLPGATKAALKSMAKFEYAK
jgi:hypothetical protein